jgi:uncharacterized protein YqcC (DUF446 family)
VTDLAAFASLADRIEAEMRRLGAWSADRPAQATIDEGGAFGMNTMAFTQWLQWVLVPRLREVADGSFPVPPSSQVAAHAVREFDGWHEVSDLEALLRELDDLVEAEAGGQGGQ